MPSFPKDHPATHNMCRNPMCRNPKNDNESPCCCFPNKDCYWEEIGGSSFSQPLGMSGEENWWERPPFRCEPCDKEQLDHYNITAIIAESRRLAIEECKVTIAPYMIWPDPVPFANKDIGPLFDSGLMTQYKHDKKKHDEEMSLIHSEFDKLYAKQK